MLLGYGKGVSWFTSVNHLSNVNVLVISHIGFSISLLGFGSPFLGHHFQVQETCRLQDLCLETLGVEDSALLFVLLVTCKCEPRALLVKELELYFC